MPKNQPAMPQATLLRRSGKTIQPWGASEPVLACISISDDSMVVKLLLIVARIVVCLPALLYQTYYILRQMALAISHGCADYRRKTVCACCAWRLQGIATTIYVCCSFCAYN